ncbi:MAG: hypothetical protein ATN35_13165 [Epulopiscium sp. Nele67-Bin004]|nr:MAG: hypothetical protein ATN35_13165 [Epulopiscium sp. Nele67-Bin004]
MEIQQNSDDIVTNPPRKVELIDDIVYMSPAPNLKHSKLMFNITLAFEMYLRGKKCKVYQVPNVFYDQDKPKNHFIPDIAVMCEPDKIKPLGYYGVPNLVVEILSSNRKDDLVIKLKLYERIGVGEYWIVDPLNDTINQYVLIDSRYELAEVYRNLTEEELEENEREQYKTIITPNLFKDLNIKVSDIFEV